jgi:transposase
MTDSKKLAFRPPSIFSRSENIDMAKDRHNPDHAHLPVINMTLLFDVERYIPVSLKALEGSVRDVKPLNKVLQEIDFRGVLLLTRGVCATRSCRDHGIML